MPDWNNRTECTATYQYDLYLVFKSTKAGQKHFYPLAKVSWEVLFHIKWTGGDSTKPVDGGTEKTTVNAWTHNSHEVPSPVHGPTAAWANKGARGAKWK